MNAKSLLFLLVFVLSFTSVFSQSKITWKELTSIYRQEYQANKTNDKAANVDFDNVSSSATAADKKTRSVKDV